MKSKLNDLLLWSSSVLDFSSANFSELTAVLEIADSLISHVMPMPIVKDLFPITGEHVLYLLLLFYIISTHPLVCCDSCLIISGNWFIFTHQWQLIKFIMASICVFHNSLTHWHGYLLYPLFSWVISLRCFERPAERKKVTDHKSQMLLNRFKV